MIQREHGQAFAHAPDDYERLNLSVTDAADDIVALTTDPDGTTLSDVLKNRTPFDGLYDPFGLLDIDDPMALIRRRIMEDGHGLARALTDTRAERRSLEKGKLTRLGEVEFEDVCSFYFSAKKTETATQYWLERSDTDKGFILVQNNDGTVLVKSTEMEHKLSLDDAMALVEDGKVPDKQDMLFHAAHKFLLAFAEMSGLDPTTLKEYGLTKSIPDIVKETEPQPEKTATREKDGSLKVHYDYNDKSSEIAGKMLKLMAASMGVILVGGLVASAAVPIYEAFTKAVETVTDKYEWSEEAPDVQPWAPQSGVMFEAAPAAEALVPEEAYHTSQETGDISLIAPERFDTSAVTPLTQDTATQEYLAQDGVHSITIEQDGQLCFSIRGNFSNASPYRPGAFYQDELIGGVSAYRLSDTVLQFCKRSGEGFLSGETVYFVQQSR